MSLVNILNVEVLDNPTAFTNPFQFQITFESVAPGIKEGTLVHTTTHPYRSQLRVLFFMCICICML
jgi:hypothetical protein